MRIERGLYAHKKEHSKRMGLMRITQKNTPKPRDTQEFPPRLTSRPAVQLPKIPRPACPQSHNQLMLIARAPQNHKLNFKCKNCPKPLTVFLKALWKLMRAILGWWRITRLMRPPTDATTLRAFSIEMLWLCVAAESQSSRGLLQQRSSIEPGHRRVASSGADTTTVTEEGL